MRGSLMVLGLLVACKVGGNASGTIDDIPDVRDDLVKNPGCETVTDSDGNEQPVPGATTWYIGEFAFDGDGGVEGKETWHLLANDAWVATGEGHDCDIVWTVAGSKVEPFSCTTCDYGLDMQAFLETEQSDCVAGLVNDQPTVEDLQYDVLELSDGTARFSFPSGNPLGNGQHGNGWVSYVTDGACKWF